MNDVLLGASMNGHISLMEQFIQEIRQGHVDLISPLEAASGAGQIKVVQWCLNRKRNIMTRGALYTAVRNEQIPVIELLLENGTSKEDLDNAYDVAKIVKCKKIMDYLRQQGAESKVED